MMRQLAVEFFSLTARMAPYLLGGFFLAGVMNELVPRSWVSKKLGEQSKGSILRSVLIGIPLPLCSCGVLPLALALQRGGASAAALIAFLIATPVTGVDSILATYALLGLQMTLARLVASILLALLAGYVLVLLVQHEHSNALSKRASVKAVRTKKTVLKRIKGIISFGFGELLESISTTLAFGLLAAALLGVLIPSSWIEQYAAGGFWAYPVMVLVGMPLYVCATGSIPVAAMLLLKGATPGAALAFLIAGPVTNAASVGVVNKILGKRGLMIYLLTVLIGAMLAGYSLDLLLPHESVKAVKETAHTGTLTITESISGAILLLFIIYYSAVKLRQWLKQKIENRDKPMQDRAQQNRVVLKVVGMTCLGCARSVTSALKRLETVQNVQVDLATGTVTVTSTEPPDRQALEQAVRAAGYEIFQDDGHG